MSDDNMQTTISQLMKQNAQINDSLEKILDELRHVNQRFIPVKIENINMPFWALVGFLIKVSLASIPAAILLFIIYTIVIAVLGASLSSIF